MTNGANLMEGGNKMQANLGPEMDDEFLDEYGDEYDDYGSQSQGLGYAHYDDPNAGMIDGSGRSYDDEDITDESGKLINKVLAQ